MEIDRRTALRGIGGLSAAVAIPALESQLVREPILVGAKKLSDGFPRKDDFLIEEGSTYLNAAYTHPIPKVALAAAEEAAQARCSMAGPLPQADNSEGRPAASPRTLFARLINARDSEIAHVSSTSAGENLIVQALGLDHAFDGNVVTDGLHFEGAVMHLLELKKKGLDVRIAKPTDDGRIELRDLEKLFDRHTKLVEVSSVSMFNGFRHDLKALCDLAHAHGALVYADIIHSAGAEPFDVKASGVDFAACSTFKWLMGDFGIGFLYAKEEIMDRIRRPVFGYFQADTMEPFLPPHWPNGEYSPVGYQLSKSAAGMFETGTLAGRTAINTALLSASLEYILGLGVANILAHRQPLIQKLQTEVARLGLTPMTPSDANSPMVTFARKNIGTSEIRNKLEQAKVNVRLANHWLRISPSIYNDMADIDRFLQAIA